MNVKVKPTNQYAADRIMRALDDRLIGGPKPTRRQVAIVLNAMANLTDVQSMVNFDRMGKEPQGQDPTKETKYWPTEMSIGRWLHAVADDLEEDPSPSPPTESLDALVRDACSRDYYGPKSEYRARLLAWLEENR